MAPEKGEEYERKLDLRFNIHKKHVQVTRSQLSPEPFTNLLVGVYRSAEGRGLH